MFVASVAALLAVTVGCGGSTQHAGTTTTSPTSESSTVAPTTMPPTTGSVVPAPPGRLPPVDVTAEIAALFPTPFANTLPMELAVEVTVRLRSSFETTGFFADVGGVSLISYPVAGGDEAAFVIEVRNREESGDDTSPGYDLVVVMQPDQNGTWAVTSATRQTICSRGPAAGTDPPLCV